MKITVEFDCETFDPLRTEEEYTEATHELLDHLPSYALKLGADACSDEKIFHVDGWEIKQVALEDIDKEDT